MAGTADRILQLKLISDVADINSKMGTVTKDVGKAKKAFGMLKSFAGPIMAGIGLKLASSLAGSFKAQLKHAEDLRNALVGLEVVGKSMGLPEGKIRRVADALRDIGVSLGVGEDAKIVGALRDIAAITGKMKQSQAAVEAIFDVMRAFDVDFDTAKNTVINGILLGRSRYLDQLGLSAETVGGRLKEFNKKYGTAAEEFAATSEGKWQVASAEFDGHMLNLAIVADQALAELKLQLIIGWNNLTGIIDGIAAIWEGVQAEWGDDLDAAVAKIKEALEPVQELFDLFVVGPIEGVATLLASIWKAVTGDVDGAMDDITGFVRSMANTVISLLNRMSGAFAFEASFDVPEIRFGGNPDWNIPDVVIGGGTLDFSRGRLFDVIEPLAAGGIVRSPTLALLGESGPEAVVPLGSGGLGTTINVYASAVSPADVGRAVVEAIEAHERRSGAGWRA